MRETSDRIAFLDGWRALAIGLVLLDHLGMNREIGAAYARGPIGIISEFGEVGVFIFFFISGYVVSRTSLKEVEASGDFSARGFYLRRSFRIVPPLMLYLFACLALGGANLIDFSSANFLSSALYLCNSTAPHVDCNWYVGHTWSLAFEEQFYLLFPLVFSFLELRKKPNPLIAILAAFIAAIPLVFVVWWIGRTGFFIAYGLFFVGYAAAKQGNRFVGIFARHRSVALIVAALVVFLPRSVVASFGADEAARADLIAYYRLLHVAAIPTLVLLSGAVEASRGFLSNRAVSHVGRASYSIYLWQQLFNGPVFAGLDIASAISLLICVSATCIVIYDKIETPLIEKGRALSRARREDRAPNGAAPSAAMRNKPAPLLRRRFRQDVV